MTLFSSLVKATRMTRKGKPISAMLALQKAMAPAAKRKLPAKAKAPHARAAPRAPASPRVRLIRPAPGSFEAGHFICKQGALDYKLYTPLGSARRTLPLVVMLHGCTQNAADFAAATQMNDLADELGFLVLYPEQSRSANMGRCWNWHRPGDQERGGGEPAVIAALTRQILRTSRGNPARVYIAGLSAGGALAAIVGAAYPDLFVAAGVHSGLARGSVGTLSEALRAMRHGSGDPPAGSRRRMPPLIVFHGARDTTVYPCNAAGFLAALRQSSPVPLQARLEQGVSAGGRPFTRTLYRAGDGPVLLEDWMVQESGHAWSGGSPAGSYTDPAGPDASREMLRFFLARRRGAAVAKSRS